MINKYLEVENKTEYSSPDWTKTKNRVLNPLLNCVQVSKQKSYEIRAYYEYLNTLDKGGKTFYVTATFNQSHLPHFHKVPCFDYELFRKFINGGFKKHINRHYSCDLKYLCVSELGSLNSRPHHHFLIYVIPNSNKSFPLNGNQFLDLFSKYWIDSNGKHIGYCFKGKYGCEVINYRAFNYCCKYVGKDINTDDRENLVYKNCYNDMFNELLLDYKSFLKYLSEKDCSYKFDNNYDRSFNAPDSDIDSIFIDFSLNPKYIQWCKIQAHRYAHGEVNEFLLHYSNRPRCSNNFGSCLADPNSKFFIDPFNPKVKMPYKNKFKYEQIPLYIYRKLYYDSVIDIDSKGNKQVLYKLNYLGIHLKSKEFEDTLFSNINSNKGYFNAFKNNPILQERLNIDIDLNDISDHVISKYTVFNSIYRNRLYRSSELPDLDFIKDYINSLYSGLDTFEKSYALSKKDLSDYTSYLSHPFFRVIAPYVSKLDAILSYMYVSDDTFKNNEFRRLKLMRERHNINSNFI